ASRVGPCEPLFLIMFDHGNDNVFSVSNPGNPDDVVYASDLANWLNTLESATGASTYIVLSACHSGSFIDELSKSGSVIITSTNQTECGWFSGVPPYNEFFLDSFWPRIKMGDSLLDAFNPASEYADSIVPSSFGPLPYHPLLDDDGDGVGHGWDTPPSSGVLPHDGDGYLAENIYVGDSVWVYPQMDSVVAAQFYAWPPTPNQTVTLWADVDNDSALLGVTAWMLPPDWVPPTPSNVLVQVPF